MSTTGLCLPFVTPDGCRLEVCDSEATHEIFARRLDFVRPARNYNKLQPTSLNMTIETDPS
jgi:hypothetical protein